MALIFLVSSLIIDHKVKMEIYIDADACPVREETYKVARRHAVPVTVVSNSFLRVPRESLITFIAVSDSFDAADDYIAERSNDSSIVITSDILLAERCLKSGASVLAPNGKPRSHCHARYHG